MKYSYSLLAAAAAVLASPVPQAVTSAIAPSGSVPASCSSTYSGSFAIVAITQAPQAGKRQVITQISDGQIQAPTSGAAVATASPHSSSAAGAVAASSGAAAVGATSSPHSSSAAAGTPAAHPTPVAGSGIAPVSRASSAAAGTAAAGTAPAGPKPYSAAGAAGPKSPASAAATGAVTTMVAVSQIHDGQIQAPRLTSAVPATAPAPGSPAAPTSSRAAVPVPSGASTPASSAAAVPAPGSPKAPSNAATAPASPPKSSSSPAGTGLRTTVSVFPTASRPTGTAISHLTDGQPQGPTSAAAAPSASSIAACATNGTLTLTLADGVLKDARGWTGYIASNYQFQFDDPPQSGAIYTAGFSVCGGNLALGGSTTWYECLSGDFYNLYSENIAPQCTPITLNVAQLTSC